MSIISKAKEEPAIFLSGFSFATIGIDPNRSNRSPFYALEQKILEEMNVKVLRL